MAVTPNLGLPLLEQGNTAARADFNDAMGILDSAVGAAGGTVELEADDDFIEGDLVAFFEDTDLKARLAYADGSTLSAANLGRIARGVATAAVGTGDPVTVKLLPSLITRAAHGFAIGAQLWLSNSTPGGWTDTAPSAGLDAVQEVGVVWDADRILWTGTGVPYTV